MSTSTIIGSHCNSCARDTHHAVEKVFESIATVRFADDAEPAEQDIVERTSVLKCQGCDAVKLMAETIWPGISDDERDATYFPPAIFRRVPRWLIGMHLKARLQSEDPMHGQLVRLVVEIYRAFGSSALRLAAMGIRALLESIMIHQLGADQGTFKKNLEAFARQGHIGSRQAEQIEAILEAGHAAIHRGYSPSQEDLESMLDLAENLLYTVYRADGQAACLTAAVPKRGSS